MNKLDFESFRSSLSHFLIFPDVEDKIELLLQQRIAFAKSFQPNMTNKSDFEILMDFLKDGDIEMKLRLLFRITGGSLEKFKRIYADFTNGGLHKIQNNEELRKRVVNLFISSESENLPTFVTQGFILPTNWIQLLNDDSFLKRIMRDDLSPQYSVYMGLKFESEIAKIVTDLGLEWKKGEVLEVGRKEVDLAIPNCQEPKILIMASYSLTTSSAQTQRANEQMDMYNKLHTYNRSRAHDGKTDRIFINVVDGGGWIQRKNDLMHLWKNCDYCFSYNTLNELRKLLQNYVVK